MNIAETSSINFRSDVSKRKAPYSIRCYRKVIGCIITVLLIGIFGVYLNSNSIDYFLGSSSFLSLKIQGEENYLDANEPKAIDVQRRSAISSSSSSKKSTLLSILPNQCRKHFETDENGRTWLHIAKAGRWKRISNEKTSRSYDQRCFAMRPRYNCAIGPDAPIPEHGVATDWRFILQEKASDVPCDVREVIEDVGGPDGVGRRVLARQRGGDVGRRLDKEGDIPGDGSAMLNVLIAGNSHLRQLFESLTCLWQDQITDGFMQQNKENLFSIDGMKNMRRQGITYNDLEKDKLFGRRLNMTIEFGVMTAMGPEYPIACRSYSGKFYEANVEIPQSHSWSCSDNLAMVEFGKSIRFYYVFRPHVYSDTGNLYDFMGFNLSKVDIIVTNDKEEIKHPVRGLIQSLKRDGKRVMNFDTLVGNGFMRHTQARDIKYWFGAINPWITKPRPDVHACMPGVPDDIAYLFLSLILFDANLLYR